MRPDRRRLKQTGALDRMAPVHGAVPGCMSMSPEHLGNPYYCLFYDSFLHIYHGRAWQAADISPLNIQETSCINKKRLECSQGGRDRGEAAARSGPLLDSPVIPFLEKIGYIPGKQYLWFDRYA